MRATFPSLLIPAKRRKSPIFHRSSLKAANRLRSALFQQLDALLAVQQGKPPLKFARNAIRHHFDLDVLGPCFASAPHVWSSFHEPQLTKGFVHFLTEGSAAQRLLRTLAFVGAAYRCAGKVFPKEVIDSVLDFEIVAEERTAASVKRRGKKRVESGSIDIVAQIVLTDGTVLGAAIEAKFDHRLSHRQLEKYSSHLQSSSERLWTLEKTAQLVVGRNAPEHDVQSWKSVTWWQFLHEIERGMQSTFDDTEYMRFRRTVWETAYG